jgi:hypothetical protein
MNYKLYATLTILSSFTIPIFGGGLSMPIQKVYAQSAYPLSDQLSCEGLPSAFGGSTSWDPSSNTCIVDGTLTIPSDTQLSVIGVTLRIAESGTLNNYGDPLYNQNLGIIENLGTINNYGGISPSSGHFDNAGTLNNYAAIAYYGDTFTNTGVINNYGSDSTAASGFGGIHLYSLGGGADPELDDLENSGTVNNHGGIYLGDNNIRNSGTLHNYDDGIIVNFRIIENFDSIVNDGIIDNNSLGEILNYCDSSFSGSGTVEGNPPQDRCNDEPPTPTEAINLLISDVENLEGVHQSVKTRLIGPLERASDILNDNNPRNDPRACNMLGAFMDWVDNNERRDRLPSDDAAYLRTQAEAIRSQLGC